MEADLVFRNNISKANYRAKLTTLIETLRSKSNLTADERAISLGSAGALLEELRSLAKPPGYRSDKGSRERLPEPPLHAEARAAIFNVDRGYYALLHGDQSDAADHFSEALRDFAE